MSTQRPAPPGRVVVVVGPSGAGKDLLMAGLCAAHPEIHRARRTISRPPAPGSESFESVTPEAFARARAEGAFVLDWQAHGLCYGLRAREFAPLDTGRMVLFNGARRALAAAAARFPTLEIVSIRVPQAVLAARLEARGRETPDVIARRLAQAALPLPQGLPPDLRLHEVINDASPAEGIARLEAALFGPAPAPAPAPTAPPATSGGSQPRNG
ncbi:phosphonate metabolism protein/1,5-bisphosphokinase (PRPP-forming) PhnN [Phaeovulum vinaykumarii]|uniref:Ribose 1,5-bisphosphokinase n=1 Tax=Phaeovulum vinaykumarii TaxID=407234 RepID=A0A1N7LXS3_9RHOB|nr:phosphonate metabolism protein/1,5-bisphosphokinase (PRPP-forming) PhnN [Phaeovulum vinaykumarii]SIS78617.1 ribose 1,5-bisphosphokinase [Phaeovulum vinaykumarii]SOC06930.1 ribose 1,5-bisphosphokinase [Phaeovulum vinaykumarii]